MVWFWNWLAYLYFYLLFIFSIYFILQAIFIILKI